MTAVSTSRPPHRPALRRSALQMAVTPWWVRSLGIGAYLLMIGTAAAFAFVPWTQTVRGRGSVIAVDPGERRQNIDTPVSGQVVQWLVREGSVVKKGMPVAEMRDNDPQFLENLRNYHEQAVAKRDATAAKVAAYKTQVDLLEEARHQAIAKAEADISEAKEKLAAYRAKLTAADADHKAAAVNFERQKALLDLGLVSRRDFELAELKFNETRAYVEEALANIAGATKQVGSKESERLKLEKEADAKISSASADHRGAVSELASAESALVKTRVDLSRQQQIVPAPRDGTILRLLVNVGAEQLKAGDSIATFVPDVGEQAVELYVTGNDAPLIFEGARVRLQFEGWPAVQFTPGWPSKAIGTFGGVVRMVDPTDNGMSEFRVMVGPDPDLESDPELCWPTGERLRQGGRANGWILLREVSLGYEFWRQLNGFPIVPKEPKSESAGKKSDKSAKMTRSFK